MASIGRARRPAILLALSLWFIACAGSPAQAPASSLAPAPPLDVSVAQAAAMREDGAIVLDVREPAEFAAGHIQGATLIPLGQLPARLDEVPRDRSVIVVCRTGHRSAQGRDILRAAGFEAATSMAGGMTEWVEQGQPTVTGGGIQ